MVTLTINGKTVEAEEGTFVLAAARNLGIDIPAACAHGAVEPFSACRLCMVEIQKKGWTDDWTKMVASCIYPVEEGLKVWTDSERVIRVRKTLFELLLARCPESDVVRDWAKQYGVESTDFTDRKPADKCILCATCTRVCAKMGASAISTNQRGTQKRVGAPFGEPKDCIGCLSCAHNCPTGHIQFKETEDSRKIWNKNFEMAKCSECGVAHVTKEQVAHYVKTNGLSEDHFLICDECKQKRTADVFAGLTV